MTATAPRGSARAARRPDRGHVDVLVIGSGFGGSVAALRAAEKGYRVVVLEAGRRFADTDFPKTSWQMRDYLWAPRLGCTGIQRMTLLRDVLVLSGAGVGGGSLVYANTLYRPLSHFYDDPQWAGITDWEAELAEHYDVATGMLGVHTYPFTTPSDVVMREVATRMGVADTFHPTPVGVLLPDADTPGSGTPGAGAAGETVADPYFGGVGPERVTCTQCGGCMTGCRVGAKNTLVKNYLHLAEDAGAVVHPLTTVTRLEPLPDGGWRVTARRTAGRSRRDRTDGPGVWTADQVVLAAGALGTQRLLHAQRDLGTLPGLSPRLGELTRTNSEAIVGAAARKMPPEPDYSHGVAITSSFHPDDHTHIEPVRYGPGSNAMGLLGTLPVPGEGRLPRPVRFVGTVARHPVAFARTLSVRRWSQKSIIALVMQSHDNSINVRRTRTGRLTSRPADGKPSPTYIPEADRAARLVAEQIDGQPLGSITEVVDIPVTAHILGGAVIGATPQAGVIDPYHRVHGYPTLHVMDGAAVTANLGVNPSLTITAQAERAMAMWPNAGEPDPRPAPGEEYRPVPLVTPLNPTVPVDAPAFAAAPGAAKRLGRRVVARLGMPRVRPNENAQSEDAATPEPATVGAPGAGSAD